VEGPGVVIEAEDKSSERFVELTGHFAVVASVVVEFSASWRGSTVIDSGSDSRNREDTGAKNTFSMDVVVFVSDDGSNPTGNDARCGTCVRHPSFSGKVGDVDGRGWLRHVWRTGVFGMIGAGERDRVVRRIVMSCFVGWRSEVEEEA